MTEFLAKVPDLLQVVALIGMAVSILATLIARLTPTKVDDEAVGKVTGFFVKALQWLPTIGVNPRTKKLEEAYLELKEKEAEKNVQAPPTA